MSRIDDMNYYNDPRVISSMVSNIYKIEQRDGEYYLVFDEDMVDEHNIEEPDNQIESEYIITTTNKLCHMCGGDGTVVNPSIDAGGLTSDDFAEDPDFYDDYRSRVYDISCPECKGNKVIKDPNMKDLPKHVIKIIEECEADAYDDARTRAAELAYGY